MVSNKRNFRSLGDVEKELHKVSIMLLNNKVSASNAQDYAKICDSWVKTRKQKDTELLLKRVDGLEELYRSGKKV